MNREGRVDTSRAEEGSYSKLLKLWDLINSIRSVFNWLEIV